MRLFSEPNMRIGAQSLTPEPGILHALAMLLADSASFRFLRQSAECPGCAA